MICPFCEKEAVFMSTLEFFGKDYGTNLYVCRPCDARVSTHGNTSKPMGTMANPELREWRKVAHAHFDILWKNGHLSRTGAYRWLQEKMGMTKEQAHIGNFTVSECQRVVEHVCKFTPAN